MIRASSFNSRNQWTTFLRLAAACIVGDQAVHIDNSISSVRQVRTLYDFEMVLFCKCELVTGVCNCAKTMPTDDTEDG